MKKVAGGFKKMLTAAGVFSACVIALSSCGGGTKDSGDKGAGGKDVKTLQELNVLKNITYYTNALSYIAYEEGFYKDYGLNVKYTSFNGMALESVGALMSKKFEVLNTGGSAGVLTMMERGEDGDEKDNMVFIGGIMSEGAALVTLPKNASKWTEFTNETLAGKKIGTTRANSGDIAFRKYLTDAGVDKAKYTMVEIGAPPNIIEAVRKGEVDAGLVYLSFRRIAETSGLTVVKHIDELVPAFVCCRVVVRRETLDTKRGELVAFLKGQIKAYRVYLNEKEKSVKYVAKHITVDEAVIRDELYDYGHFNIVPDPYTKKIKDFYAGMTDIGYTAGTLDLSKRMDVTLYRDALTQVLAEEPNDPVFLELKRIHTEYN